MCVSLCPVIFLFCFVFETQCHYISRVVWDLRASLPDTCWYWGLYQQIWPELVAFCSVLKSVKTKWSWRVYISLGYSTRLPPESVNRVHWITVKPVQISVEEIPLTESNDKFYIWWVFAHLKYIPKQKFCGRYNEFRSSIASLCNLIAQFLGMNFVVDNIVM